MRRLFSHHHHLNKLLSRNPNPRFPKPPPPSLNQSISSSSSSSATAANLHRPLSRIPSNTFSSWRRGVSPSSSLGFLSYQFLSKAKKPLDLAGFVESGIHSLKVSLRRRRGFDFGRRFSIPGLGYWRYLNLTPDGVVLGLIGANVAVFFLWRIGSPRFMRNHFMISLDNFKSGRLHTLVTCAFSHVEFDHLLSNMIGLYFFGTNIGRLFGPEYLLKLYLAGALGGSIFFLLHKFLIAPSSKGTFGWDSSRVPGLGASGAVNAIILLNVFLFPKDIYYINLIIPVPAMLMGALIIGTDLWRVKKGEGDISGSAHLGGALVAALAWARIKHWI
ncbi:RHOMBOID-like protein 12, mitochondrial [Asparagus officinalis]|uniref:RHOMBOID-like protein 12, mitochondrial n=1 Tax=Asparagus officinalis TaxID=4686 RepID=UPI00098DE81E|nr:RHOMBOID-like protein 12, mitochondrial [Asparagus officinalis]